MYSTPQGYVPLKDGDIIKVDDIMLGKIKSVCGQDSYGWSKVSPYLIGEEFYASGMDAGKIQIMRRKAQP